MHRRQWWVMAGGALCWGLLAATAATQDIRVLLADGRSLTASMISTTDTDPPGLRLHAADQDREVPWADVLSLHGPPPEPAGEVLVQLVGGDRLRGAITEGDSAGEWFTVSTASLGDVRVPVDRLAVGVFAAAGDERLDAFRIADDSGSDEAVFRRVGRGFDMLPGAIDRFTSRGVMFEAKDGEAPALFAYDDISAVALRGGIDRQTAPDARLLTRSGDVVRVVFGGIGEGRLSIELEGGQKVAVALADVAAFTVLREGRRFLSDLQPTAVEEVGPENVGASRPLLPFQRDRSLTGGALVAGGYTYDKGLAVHARSVLTYVVPEGYSTLTGRVGIDDQVLATAVRGSAEVSVVVDGQARFGPTAVRAGAAPLRLGIIDVKAGATLQLVAEFGEGWFLGDRVDWLSPVLLR